jgi:hypothetical protein
MPSLCGSVCRSEKDIHLIVESDTVEECRGQFAGKYKSEMY